MSSSSFWHPTLERCGFILKDGTVVEVENTSATPSSTFKISEDEISNIGLENICIFWHSHPSGNVNLSLDDYFAFLSFPDQKHRIYNQTGFAEYYVRRGFVMREEEL